MYLRRQLNEVDRAGMTPFSSPAQVAVETVVLQQDNGSMAQRVQAEFLSELCKRIEAAAPQEQRPPPGILE